MPKKTIGILTHWSIPNFGAFLQAYALRNVLENKFPNYEVRQIAYMNRVHYKMYYSLEVHEMFKYWYINPHFYFDVIKRVSRLKQFIDLYKFREYYNQIPHSAEFNKDNICKASFDVVVLGSDILWDYSISFYNNDKPVFGYLMNYKKIFSYAASFGTVKPNMIHPKYVCDGLLKLCGISVRDENSKQIAESITNRVAELVLDPTLLWDFCSDRNVVNPKISDYIAVYGSYFTEEQIESVKNYAKKNNYKIVFLDSIGDKCSWCDIYLDASQISPFEWCGYIKNSNLVMTCTFHGLMFGLIFKKRIVFNPTNFMKDKCSEFLIYLNLGESLLQDNCFANQLEYKWDYDKINKKIQSRRYTSFKFLESMLN